MAIGGITASALRDDGKTSALTSSRVKPGLSPTLICMVFQWVACACALQAFSGASSRLLLIVMLSCGVLSLALGFVFALGRREGVARWVLLGVAFGLFCAAYGALQMDFERRGATTDSRVFVVRLVEDARESSFGSRARAVAIDESGREATVEALLPHGVFALRGSAFRWQGVIESVPEKAAEYYASQGVVGMLDASGMDPDLLQTPRGIELVRKLAVERFADNGGSRSAILQALICGYQEPVESSGEYDAYKITGLAHIVAVSGSHLAIVAAFVEWTLGVARVGGRARRVTVIVFTLIYLVFSGTSVSAVRSAAMVVVAQLSFVFGRRNSAAHALSVCVMLFIALDPVSSVSASLFLSAASTLGIVLFSGLVNSWFAARSQWAQRLLVEPVALTLASSLATQPVSAALFSQLPLIAPLANIAVAPLFSIACITGLIAAVVSVICAPLASITVNVAALCVTPLAELVDVMSRIPYASIPVDASIAPMVALTLFGVSTLYIAWPKLERRLVVAIAAAMAVVCAAAIVVPSMMAGDEIIALDVGQGDALLVRSRGRAVLVDTGTQDSLLRRALARHGAFALDAVIITHGDDDHCGSLESLSGVERIGGILLSAPTFICGCDSCEDLVESAEGVVTQHGVRPLTVGDVVRVGNFQLEMISPRVFSDDGGNADSVCLLVRYDGDSDGDVDWTALLCGDAEAEVLARLREEGVLASVDVLKVGHHGSRASLTEDLAHELDAEIALISCGAGNRYGHPAPEIIEILGSCGTEVFRTDELGDVCVSFTSERISCTPQLQ